MPSQPSRRTVLLAGLAAPLVPVLLPEAARAAASGTLATVGLGSDGQLGSGSTANRTAFEPVVSLSGIVGVHGGREHVIALDGAGAVWTWGDGRRGALGNGSTADRTTPGPVDLPAGRRTIQVTTGHYDSFALLDDATLLGWGMNALGQLADGTTTRRTRPVLVGSLTGVRYAAAGRDMGYAVLQDGTVSAWGGGANGELGNGTNPARQLTPVTVSGLGDVVEIAGGRNHAVARLADGTLRAWGLNKSGQLGDGTRTSHNTPVIVKGVSGVARVAAGATHSVALLTDGTVLTWGEGSRGQLGSGSQADRLVAAAVAGVPAGASVHCGRDHTLVVTRTGQLWDWGMDDYGQLGDGSTTNQLRPVNVAGISDAVAAGGGRGYTVLLGA